MTPPEGDAGRWYREGVEHLDAGRLERARQCFERTLEFDPQHARARCNLGAVLQWEGKDEEAGACYQDALAANSSLAQAWFNLGILDHKRGRLAGAIGFYRRAIELEPGQAEWHSALGSAFGQDGRPLQGLRSTEAALRLEPRRAELHEQLGNGLLDIGEIDAAINAYRCALELNPALHRARSRILHAMNLSPSESPASIFAAHVAWAREGAAAPQREFGNDPLPMRRLRIGYCAPDFGDPSVSCLIQPVLAAHDRSHFQVICYSDTAAEDPACWPLRTAADVWHATGSLDDERLTARLLEDGIDILVDLAGHAGGGRRMDIFAARGAPLQISWPSYPSTTGLAAYDGRISDRYACPEEAAGLYAERLLRMPVSQWCFAPQAAAPDDGPRSGGERGTVTFGAFCAPSRISPQAIAAWTAVLRAVPSSRLVIGGRGMGELAGRFVERFAKAGIEAGRIECRDRLPLQAQLAALDRIDVALDAFPVSGVAGTFYALWMGVPVVALAGPGAAGRGSAGILNALGLGEWIAQDAQGYAAIAASLAADPARRGALRRELRSRLAGSALMDAAGYTRALEQAYRELWRGWCAGKRRRQSPDTAIETRDAGPRLCTAVVDGVFYQEHDTGIARVWRSILQEWVRTGFAANVVLLDRGGTAPDIAGVKRRIVARHDYGSVDADRAMLQRVCDEVGARAFISTYYSAPLTTPTVMMVYDMIPEVVGYDLELPEWREKKICIEAARRYIAISHNTLRDLQRIHPGIARACIDVAHPAAEPSFRPAAVDEMEGFKARHGITRPYFLLVGARDSQYKNARAFFRAFAALPDRSRYGALCVGGEREVAPSARQACSGSELHHLRLDDGELRLAYGGAIALVYPSIYEGFGMPVVEAMRCGCPVITTSHASLPEVAGDAAIFVNPHDVDGLALALARVQRPEVRDLLIARGLQRAKVFSWTRMAETVASALERVAGGKATADAARAS